MADCSSTWPSSRLNARKREWQGRTMPWRWPVAGTQSEDGKSGSRVCRKSWECHERPGSGGCFHDFSTPLGLQQDFRLCCSDDDDGRLFGLDALERLEEGEQRYNRSGGCDSDFSSSIESLDLDLQPDESYGAYISGMTSLSKYEAKKIRRKLRKQMKSSAEQTSWPSIQAVCDKKEVIIKDRESAKDRESVKCCPDVKQSWIYNLGLTRRKAKPLTKVVQPALETTTKGRMPALLKRR